MHGPYILWVRERRPDGKYSPWSPDEEFSCKHDAEKMLDTGYNQRNHLERVALPTTETPHWSSGKRK